MNTTQSAINPWAMLRVWTDPQLEAAADQFHGFQLGLEFDSPEFNLAVQAEAALRAVLRQRQSDRRAGLAQWKHA